MNRLNSIKRYGKIGILFFFFFKCGLFHWALFVNNTTSLNADGIEENYNGNFTEDESDEFDLNQEIKYEIGKRNNYDYTRACNFIFAIFFCTGLLLYFCELHLKLNPF